MLPYHKVLQQLLVWRSQALIAVVTGEQPGGINEIGVAWICDAQQLLDAIRILLIQSW